jgi:hypothetical protein
VPVFPKVGGRSARAVWLPINVGGPAACSSADSAGGPATGSGGGRVAVPVDVPAAGSDEPNEPTLRGLVMDADWAGCAELPTVCNRAARVSVLFPAPGADFPLVRGDVCFGWVVVRGEFADVFDGAADSSAGWRAPFTVKELS